MKNECFQTLVLVTLILAVFLPGVTVAGDDVWTTSGPYGAYVRDIAIKPDEPNVVFAAMQTNSTNNVFRSQDRGQSWHSSSSGLPSMEAWDLEFDPINTNIMYVALIKAGITPLGGVYRSSDGGISWNSTTLTVPVSTLAVSPIEPNIILAGMYESSDSVGILRSTDAGESWTAATTGPHSAYVLIPTLGNPDVFYACAFNEGVFKSIDAGLSWQAINSGFISPPECYSLAVDPFSSSILYMGTAAGGIWRTTNGGETWTPINSNLGCSDIEVITIDPSNQQTIYVGCGHNPGTGTPGVYRSTDNSGVSWTYMPEGLGTRSIYSLAIDDSNPQTIYAGTYDSGVWARTLNTNVPDYSISINDGSLFTNQTSVTLNLTAPTGTTQVIISNDGGFGDVAWEPFVTHKSWMITAHGDYVIPRTVYAKFKTYGRISGLYQDEIVLDVNAPAGSVEIIEEVSRTLSFDAALLTRVDSTWTNTLTNTIHLPLTMRSARPSYTRISLILLATDDVSGVDQMQISNEESFVDAQWKTYVVKREWWVPDTGTTTVYVKFRDRAGNVSEVYSDAYMP